MKRFFYSFFQGKNRGYATLVLIALVAILVPLANEMIFSTSLGMKTRARLLDQVRARLLARSAVAWVEMSMARFNTHRRLEIFGSKFPAIYFPERMFGKEATVQFRLESEGGKININSFLVKGLYNEKRANAVKRLLIDKLQLEDKIPPELRGSLRVDQVLADWMDKDNVNTGGFGAENLYYNTLDPRPYNARNGSIQSLSELKLLKGWGEFPDLSHYFTLYGEDSFKVDINTVDSSVLSALFPEMTPRELEEIVERRTERFGNFKTMRPIDADVLKQDWGFGWLADSVAYTSKVTRVQVKAKVGGVRVGYRVYIDPFSGGAGQWGWKREDSFGR